MKITKSLINQLKKITLVVTTGEYDYESGQDYAYDSRENAYDAFRGFYKDGCAYFNKQISEANTIDQIINLVCRAYMDGDCVYRVVTEAQLVEIEAEKERKEIESAAADFARECGFPVATKGYIKAARAALNKQISEDEMVFSGEAKMERYAACRFAGCAESYWEDEDYISTQQGRKMERLERVLLWLEENCPLLMAKVNEEN